MSTSTSTPPQPPRAHGGSRRQAIIWGLLAGVLALLVGLTWLLGGFDSKATPWLGPEATVGEVIETRFWDVEVHRAYVEPGEAMVKLETVITNKTEHHATQLTSELLLLRIEETGEVLGSTYCAFPSRSTFNPLIRTAAICEFGYEYNEITDPPTEDFSIRVLVLDQEIRESLLTAPEPGASDIAANVPLEVIHLMEEEQ